MNGIFSKVAGIALRSAETGPMVEVGQAMALADGGLVGDVPSSPDRGVTLLSQPQWRQVQREVAADLPWHTRRANLLLDAERLDTLIGKNIRIGGARLQIKAETKPCGLMDRLHQGLRKVLEPELRGGVYGRILEGGEIRIGDSVEIEPS
jgi:MOSC domain-containing protein YiiM